MNKIQVFVPCKIHLLGEHAVVYGKPAILTAVGKNLTVTITPRKDQKINIISKELGASVETTADQIIEQTKQAQQNWGEFVKTNNISILKSITAEPLAYVCIAIGEALLYYKKQPSVGFDLELSSEIPIGSGLGSSASIAVGVVAAVSLLLGEEFDKEIINNIAYQTEQKKHGMPSGGDNSAVTFGGLVWFRKETPELKIIQPIPFPISENLAKNFVVIATGTPEESTGEMVALVKNLYQEKPEVVDNFLESQEKLTRELLSVLKEGNESEFIRIIKAGEQNLEKIGVASEFAQRIIRDIETSGGAAKICGAGGTTKGTGVLLAYHQDKSKIEEIAAKYELPFYSVSIGVNGLEQNKL